MEQVRRTRIAYLSLHLIGHQLVLVACCKVVCVLLIGDIEYCLVEWLVRLDAREFGIQVRMDANATKMGMEYKVSKKMANQMPVRDTSGGFSASCMQSEYQA